MMRRILVHCLSRALIWVVAVELISCSTDALGQETTGFKLKLRSSRAVVRGQSPDEKSIRYVSDYSDEEVLDKALLSANPAMGGSAQDPKNCTTVTGPQGAMPNLTPSELQPSPPDSSMTSPDSVFNQNQQGSQMPAPVGTLGAGQGSLTAMNQVSNIMGDFFGAGGTVICDTGTAFGGKGGGFLAAQGQVSVPSSTAVGTVKLAENTSPIPRDRVFSGYSNFSNVQLIPGGMTVNRVVPGFEKTFFSNNASVEFRAPMASTLNSTTTLGQPYDTDHYQLGDITTFVKALLYRDDQFALSTGMGFTAPTASNSTVLNAAGTTVAHISNRAWHVLPFVGSVYVPNDRVFVQSILQFDVATNGNPVATQNNNFVLQNDGNLNQPAYLFSSFAGGYWIYRNNDPAARLSRISLLSELHLNRTLQDQNQVIGTQVHVGIPMDPSRTTNAVFGSNVIIDQSKSLLVGYVVPLDGGFHAFGGEFRVLFNWYFGGPLNPITRVQF